jgi:BMFP domain-containing protein YqiC
MREEIRKYVEAGLGALSPSKARELARSFTTGEGKEKLSRAAQELMEWSARTRERVAEMIRGEVRKQLKAMDVVTRDDLDALRKRVRDLEKAGTSGASGARATAKKSTAKKSPAKRSPAKKPTTPRPPTSTA